MTHLPVESFIIQRLEEGGWRVIRRRADLTDVPIADFVSYRDAREWVSWKSGEPKTNPYAMAGEATAQPRVIEIAIEPTSKADGGKLGAALAKLAADDPDFEVSIDRESGQTILHGVSEVHLDAKLEALRRTYGIDVRVGAPQVAFRERIRGTAEVDYTFKKQSGARGEFAHVKIAVEPNKPGAGFLFMSKILGDAVPKQYIPGVKTGVESVLNSGVVAGFPVVDVKVTLVDGAYHDVDSSLAAFEIASRAAFREALQKAGPELIEPVMKVEIVVPQDYVGSIMGDLSLRRGQIQDQDVRDNAVVIHAIVPLMNMFGYANNLREMSRERGAFTMRFDHYAPAPPPHDDPPFRPAIGMRG